MTGLSVFLGTARTPTRTIVQVQFTGLRLRSHVLRGELDRGGALVTLLQRHTQVVMVTLAQLILRPALSVVMRQFKDAGLVTYSRGQISIADRDELLRRSCGCIAVIAAEARRLETLEGDYDGAN